MDSRTEELVRLMTEHRVEVFRFIYSIMPDHFAAEEVYQRASIVMWKKFRAFESGTSFPRWAKRIAYYEALDYRRSYSRDRLEFWPGEMVDAVANTCFDNEDKLQQMTRLLEQCIERLSEKDRELVRLRYENPKRTSKAVAEMLDRPKVTVYKALGRIRKALFNCVQRALTNEQRQ